MAAFDQSEVDGAQREVQRLLGRCLLRLQQYEQLLKSMMVMQTFSGTPETLQDNLNARKAETNSKTLGTLVNRLMGDYIMKEGSDVPDSMPDHDSNSIYISTRMQLNLPAESHDALKADLRELVTLRNMLVHHFIELHDLWTVDGCLRAQDALIHASAKVDRQFEQLRTFADDINETRKAAAELLQSPQVIDLIVNGICPNGEILWPMAGAVSELRQAFHELSLDGWANLDTAVRWITQHHPGQTPKKYGCSRWRHLIHESGQFELRHFTHNGQRGAWYRERADTVD